MKSWATYSGYSGWVAQIQMHIEIFVFDMPDGTPGMNNFPVPEEKKKKKICKGPGFKGAATD